MHLSNLANSYFYNFKPSSHILTFSCNLLSPLVSNNYSCKYTFSFISKTKNANLSRKFLVSSNVTSLFNNIPLQETIDIAINLIFNHNPDLNISNKKLKFVFFF